MNVRSIIRRRFPWGERFVDGLRPLDGVRRLWHVRFGWMFLHGSDPCNKPALEGRD